MLGVVVRSPEVVVIVSGRVVHQRIVHLRAHFPLYGHEKLTVGAECTFFFAVESVQSDVLSFACSGFVVESIDHAGGVGHASPRRFRVIVGVSVDGHSAFEEFLSVVENVFAHFS